MAKPLQEISKTDFSKNYNVVKVLTTKTDIMNFVKTQYKDSKDNAMAFAVRKTHRVTLEDIMFEIKGIKTRLDNLEDRLTQIVQANNLVDPTLKTK